MDIKLSNFMELCMELYSHVHWIPWENVSSQNNCELLSVDTVPCEQLPKCLCGFIPWLLCITTLASSQTSALTATLFGFIPGEIGHLSIPCFLLIMEGSRVSGVFVLCMLETSVMSYSLWSYGSLPGSPIHGILQTRILEWVAVPSARGSSRPRDQSPVSSVSCIGGQDLYH